MSIKHYYYIYIEDSTHTEQEIQYNKIRYQTKPIQNMSLSYHTIICSVQDFIIIKINTYPSSDRLLVKSQATTLKRPGKHIVNVG